MRKVLILILGFLIFGSCTKDSVEIRNTDFTVPVLTGFLFRDYNGYPTKKIGTPNIKTDYKSEINNLDYEILFYPNPVKDYAILHIKELPSTNNPIYYWVVQAQYDSYVPNYSIDNSMVNSSFGGSPVIQGQLVGDISLIKLEFGSVPMGYYRIYVKINDVLLYDNISVYK